MNSPQTALELLQHIQIVMVETSLPANIGSALRAMKTMGIRQLVLVKPKTFPHPDIVALAAGAEDLIADIQVVDDLSQAIANSQLVFATSARSRSIPWSLVDARTASQYIIASLDHLHAQPNRNISIVFGRENHGLNNQELALANYHLTIPVNENYGVLNVAQAIQVVCYELRMTALTYPQNKPLYRKNLIQNTSDNQDMMPVFAPQFMAWDEALVSQKQMQDFYPHLEKMLIDIDFMDADNPRLLPLRLKRLFGRIQLDRMEYQLLRGIFTRVQALAHGHWQHPKTPKTTTPQGEPQHD